MLPIIQERQGTATVGSTRRHDDAQCLVQGSLLRYSPTRSAKRHVSGWTCLCPWMHIKLNACVWEYRRNVHTSARAYVAAWSFCRRSARSKPSLRGCVMPLRQARSAEGRQLGEDRCNIELSRSSASSWQSAQPQRAQTLRVCDRCEVALARKRHPRATLKARRRCGGSELLGGICG